MLDLKSSNQLREGFHAHTPQSASAGANTSFHEQFPHLWQGLVELYPQIFWWSPFRMYLSYNNSLFDCFCQHHQFCMSNNHQQCSSSIPTFCRFQENIPIIWWVSLMVGWWFYEPEDMDNLKSIIPSPSLQGSSAVPYNPSIHNLR